MKSLFGSLLALSLLLWAPFSATAQFNFTIGPDGTASLTGYTGLGGDVVVPSTVNGFPVTSIGESALMNNSNLVSVTIPEGVASIGNGAFEYCNNLISARMPVTLTNIGAAAFAQCTNLVRATLPPNVITIGSDAFVACLNLEDVSFPESVICIGSAAFLYCPNLASVTIPSSVTNIGLMAFGRDTNLTEINVDDANLFYSSADGVLFDKSVATLIEYPQGLTGPYTIPATVTNIGVYAFSGAQLSSVAIPGTVISIAPSVFEFCSSLTNVTIDDGVASIGNNAFMESGLTSVTIPDSVTNFNEAFNFCPKLTNVVIGAGSGASAGIFGPFNGCLSLGEITVVSNNPYLSSIDGVLFDKGADTLIEFPQARSGNYTVPSGVANISGMAFRDCVSLTSVLMPSTVTNTGFDAFEDCPMLSALYFMGNAPAGFFESIFPAFSGTNTTVYYLPGTTGWSTTGLSFPGIPGWSPIVVSTNPLLPFWPPTAQPAAGYKLVPWTLPNPVVLTGSLNSPAQSGAFGFIISWATNKTVVVDAATTLNNPAWQPLQTNSITNGWFLFNDPQSSNNSARFYRVRTQ